MSWGSVQVGAISVRADVCVEEFCLCLKKKRYFVKCLETGHAFGGEGLVKWGQNGSPCRPDLCPLPWRLPRSVTPGSAPVYSSDATTTKGDGGWEITFACLMYPKKTMHWKSKATATRLCFKIHSTQKRRGFCLC